MIPLAKSLLRVFLILLLIPVLLLLGCQSRIIYFPNAYHEGYRRTLEKRGGQPVRYETGQGSQAAFYLPPKDGQSPPKVVWLCFAGNGSLAMDWLSYVREWDDSFSYLLVDYPGYGDCKGKPTPGHIRDSSKQAVTALAAHLHLTVEQLQPRLAVLGHSLGTAAGLMAADDQKIQRVVLISPFTTMTEMGRRVLGWPLCYLNLHRFDNRTHLAHVCDHGARVVIFHGTADEIIPATMSRELAAAHPAQVTLHLEEGQDHNYIIGNVSPKIGAAMRELVAAGGNP